MMEIQLTHYGIIIMLIFVIIFILRIVSKIKNKEYNYNQGDVVELFLLSAAIGIVTITLITSFYYGLTGEYYPTESSTSYIRISAILGGGITFIKAIAEYIKKLFSI